MVLALARIVLVIILAVLAEVSITHRFFEDIGARGALALLLALKRLLIKLAAKSRLCTFTLVKHILTTRRAALAFHEIIHAGLVLVACIHASD